MINDEKINEKEFQFVDQSNLDREKLNRIVKTIITLENDNVKTRDLNDDEMKKKIEKIIEEEIKCC